MEVAAIVVVMTDTVVLLAVSGLLHKGECGTGSHKLAPREEELEGPTA